MTTPQQQILDKCKEIYAVVQAKYGLDLSKVDIRFDLKGRAAGMAGATSASVWGAGRRYYMRFNRDMLTREAFDHVLNETVPHEIAHIICFMNPTLGSGHDSGWKNVFMGLGGAGATRHTEAVVYGKGYTYEYTTDRGQKVRMGDKHHAYVQRGKPLTYKRGLGKVTKESAYSIVGCQGRSYTTPIVKQAVSSPAIVHAAVTAKGTTVNVIGVAAPKAVAPVVVHTSIAAGSSKAGVSRSIMLAGHGQGKSYEEIISAMMAACGYERQLARATYKANAAKVGIPMPA